MNINKLLCIISIIFLLYFIVNILHYRIESFDVCNLMNNNNNNNNNNIKSQIKKKIIIGHNSSNQPIEEEITVNQYCGLKNERCLVDPNGNNTCCNNLKCIRKRDNFKYNICSEKKNEKDACGYNTFICDIQQFDLYFEKIWEKILLKFTYNKKNNYDEDYLQKMKQKIKKDLYGTCGDNKNLSDSEQKNIINIQLNKIIFEDLVFAKPVKTIKLT